MGGGRLHAAIERGEGLRQRGHAGARDQVAEVSLDRAGRDHVRSEDARGASDFNAVAHPRAGGVAFEERDVLWFQAGRGVGGLHGADLAFFGGRQQSMAASVVRKADAADNPEDAVGVLDRVLEALEGHASSALGGDEPVRVLVERPAAAGGREGLERGEAHVDEEVVGARDRGREHQIGAAIGQRIAGELDRVERTGAGGIQRERAVGEAEIQGPGGQKRGESRGKAVARVDTTRGPDAAPDLFGEVGQARRRERQVREDEAGSRPLTIRVLDPLERFAGGVEDKLEEGVEAVDLRGREREAARIESVVEAANVAAAQGRHAVRARALGFGHELFGIDPPTAVGDRAQKVLAGEDAIEQLLRAESARKGVRLGHDRDRFESVQCGSRVLEEGCATPWPRYPPCAFLSRAARTGVVRPPSARSHRTPS